MDKKKRSFSNKVKNLYEGRKVSEHSPSLFNKCVLCAYYVPHTVNEADLENTVKEMHLLTEMEVKIMFIKHLQYVLLFC